MMNILLHSVRKVDFLLCKQFLITARWLIQDFRDKGDVNCASTIRFIAVSLCKDWRGPITLILHNVFAYLLQICIEMGLWMSELGYLQNSSYKFSLRKNIHMCFKYKSHQTVMLDGGRKTVKLNYFRTQSYRMASEGFIWTSFMLLLWRFLSF